MFVDQDDDTLQKFYTDAVNSAVFNTPVSYLQKYPSIQDYETIIHTQNQLMRLLYLIISRQIQKPSKISQFLSEQKVDERINRILSVIVSNKMSDIKKEIFRKQISRGSPCLLDNNWRIINVVSSNWSAFTSKILLNLTLVVRENGMNGESQKMVCLELNVHEVEELLTKLKQIKRSLKC